MMLSGDPYYNRNLTHFDPYCRLSTEEESDLWNIFRSMLGSVVDELRSAPRPLSGDGPRTWVPSASFDALLEDAEPSPVLLNDHLAWLHENSDLAQVLCPATGQRGEGRGRSGSSTGPCSRCCTRIS